MFKKIWSDTVWSKVIANLIIVVVAFFIGVIFNATTDKSPSEVFLTVWKYPIKFGYILIVFLMISGIRILISKIPKKSSHDKRVQKFCEKWYKLIDSVHGTIYRFKTYIHSNNNVPFITDLKVYCNMHKGQENVMSKYGGCPDPNCANSGMTYDERIIKDSIESQILLQWEKETGRY